MPPLQYAQSIKLDRAQALIRAGRSTANQHRRSDLLSDPHDEAEEAGSKPALQDSCPPRPRTPSAPIMGRRSVDRRLHRRSSHTCPIPAPQGLRPLSTGVQPRALVKSDSHAQPTLTNQNTRTKIPPRTHHSRPPFQHPRKRSACPTATLHCTPPGAVPRPPSARTLTTHIPPTPPDKQTNHTCSQITPTTQ